MKADGKTTTPVRPLLQSACELLRAAGWAPGLVFLIHVFASRGFDAYTQYPSLDIPMHFFGGVAIAYFFRMALKSLPPEAIHPRYAAPLGAVAVLALTSSAAVGWEFAEFVSDRYFGTRAQTSLDDTLLDMALGIAGGLVFLVFLSFASRPRTAGTRPSREAP